MHANDSRVAVTYTVTAEWEKTKTSTIMFSLHQQKRCNLNRCCSEPVASTSTGRHHRTFGICSEPVASTRRGSCRLVGWVHQGLEVTVAATAGLDSPVAAIARGLENILSVSPSPRLSCNSNTAVDVMQPFGFKHEINVVCRCHLPSQFGNCRLAMDQPDNETNPEDTYRDVQIYAWGSEQELIRPCVDCGMYTGNYCDYCNAVQRMPTEKWAGPNQGTPLCQACDAARNACHYCKRVAWCTPPGWRPKNKQQLPDGNHVNFPDLELSRSGYTAGDGVLR